MLARLRIRNLVVVEDTTLELGPGLNVLTGSTGSGKSLLLSALSLLAGARARREWIRQGTDQAKVEAFLNIPEALHASMRAMGIDEPQEGLHLLREVNRDGRGRVLVNGFPNNVSFLRRLGEMLWERQDQHEQIRLLDPARQMEILDDASGASEPLANYRQCLARVKMLLAREEALAADIAAIRRDEEYLRFQIDELAAVAPKPDELEELTDMDRRLRQAARTQEALARALELLEDRLPKDFVALGKALGKLDSLGEGEAHEELDAVEAVCAELAERIRARSQALASEALEADRISGRLSQLHALERKHGQSLAEICIWRDEQSARLAGLETAISRLEEVKGDRESAEEVLAAAAEELSAKREAGAGPLAAQWLAQLSELGMDGCDLRFEIRKQEDQNGLLMSDGRRCKTGEKGVEAVQILVRTNPDQAEGPLRAVPSGGELSRLSLASHLLREHDSSPPVLVLDEVDAGLSGDLMTGLAACLSRLARRRQVLLVTHQPVLAAAGDRQFRVRKRYDDKRTAVDVEQVAGPVREEEIARMLGEAGSGKSALKHARSLIGK